MTARPVSHPPAGFILYTRAFYDTTPRRFVTDLHIIPKALRNRLTISKTGLTAKSWFLCIFINFRSFVTEFSCTIPILHFVTHRTKMRIRLRRMKTLSALNWWLNIVRLPEGLRLSFYFYLRLWL